MVQTGWLGCFRVLLNERLWVSWRVVRQERERGILKTESLGYELGLLQETQVKIEIPFYIVCLLYYAFLKCESLNRLGHTGLGIYSDFLRQTID